MPKDRQSIKANPLAYGLLTRGIDAKTAALRSAHSEHSLVHFSLRNRPRNPNGGRRILSVKAAAGNTKRHSVFLYSPSPAFTKNARQPSRLIPSAAPEPHGNGQTPPQSGLPSVPFRRNAAETATPTCLIIAKKVSVGKAYGHFFQFGQR